MKANCSINHVNIVRKYSGVIILDMAVVDGAGNLCQTTGYYPSGTPYRLPSEALATEVDAATDQLHIGNRWIGHKGMALYDNTARMHDPLLARYHTVDPLYADYPGLSPWSHCAANALTLTDPSGSMPIYSPTGTFLAVDDTGMLGDFLIMDPGCIPDDRVLPHEEALRYAIDKSKVSSSVLARIQYHYDNILPTRPDYDGYITYVEGKEWYNKNSRETLYADLSKLDLTYLDREAFENGTVNLFFKVAETENLGRQIKDLLSNPAKPSRLNDALVYGQLSFHLNGNLLTSSPDKFDFDMHPWNSPHNILRNIFTLGGNIITGPGEPFKILFYNQYIIR